MLVEAFGAVTSGRGDELPGRKHPRTGDTIRRDPFLQPERNVVLRSRVAHAGDAALDEIAKSLDAAQRGVRRVHRVHDGNVWLGVVEVGVQIDEPGQHGVSRHIDDGGVRRPILARGIENRLYFVALEDQSRRTRRRASAVEQTPPSQNDGSLRPTRNVRHRNPAGIIGRYLILVEETPAVFELLLTIRGERRRQP